MGDEADFLEKVKKKFGNSLEYRILLHVFISNEISLDALFMKFIVSKSTMHSIMRSLEKEGFVEHIIYPISQIFYKIKE